MRNQKNRNPLEWRNGSILFRLKGSSLNAIEKLVDKELNPAKKTYEQRKEVLNRHSKTEDDFKKTEKILKPLEVKVNALQEDKNMIVSTSKKRIMDVYTFNSIVDIHAKSAIAFNDNLFKDIDNRIVHTDIITDVMTTSKKQVTTEPSFFWCVLLKHVNEEFYIEMISKHCMTWMVLQPPQVQSITAFDKKPERYNKNSLLKAVTQQKWLEFEEKAN